MSKKLHQENPEPGLKAVAIAMFLCFLGICLVFAWTWYYYQNTVSSETAVKEITRPPQALVHLRRYEDKILSELKWIDQAKGIIHLPIDLAKKKVLKAYD